MAEPTTIDEIREEREKGKLQIAKGKLQAKLEFQRSQLNSLQQELASLNVSPELKRAEREVQEMRTDARGLHAALARSHDDEYAKALALHEEAQAAAQQVQFNNAANHRLEEKLRKLRIQAEEAEASAHGYASSSPGQSPAARRLSLESKSAAYAKKIRRVEEQRLSWEAADEANWLAEKSRLHLRLAAERDAAHARKKAERREQRRLQKSRSAALDARYGAHERNAAKNAATTAQLRALQARIAEERGRLQAATSELQSRRGSCCSVGTAEGGASGGDGASPGAAPSSPPPACVSGVVWTELGPVSYAATPAMLDQAVADQTHLRVGIFDGGKALKEQRAHSMPELPLPPRSLEEVLRRPEAAAAAVLEMSPELRSTAARMVAGRGGLGVSGLPFYGSLLGVRRAARQQAAAGGPKAGRPPRFGGKPLPLPDLAPRYVATPPRAWR